MKDDTRHGFHLSTFWSAAQHTTIMLRLHLILHKHFLTATGNDELCGFCIQQITNTNDFFRRLIVHTYFSPQPAVTGGSFVWHFHRTVCAARRELQGMVPAVPQASPTAAMPTNMNEWIKWHEMIGVLGNYSVLYGYMYLLNSIHVSIILRFVDSL